MKHKGWYIALFALTVVLLALPMAQQYGKWFEFKPLNGVTLTAQQPKLTWKGFMDGTFQRQEDQYLSENIGFREPLIRCYNQLTWSLFHHCSNASIFIGDDNWIFNDFTIRHFYGQSVYDFRNSNEDAIEKMQSDAQMLYLLQNILQEYGITFFVCLAPEKDLVCKEHVPKVKGFTRPPGILAIDYYPPVFDSLGINYIDFSSYYMAIRDTVSYPLYLKSSSHWSNQAAVIAADSLFRYMEALSGLNLHNLAIGEEYLDQTHFLDSDLEDVMNLMWPIESGLNRYNKIAVENDSSAVKPRWLSVGDSYYKGFLFNLSLDLFFDSYHYWYYNKIVHDDPLHNDVQEVDLLRELLSSDIVMLIYSPSNLFDLNRGFLTRSLFELFFDDNAAQGMLEKIKQDIRNTPQWYASIEQKALSAGVDVEQSLEENAQYMLYNTPNLYFEEFNASEVPTRRNSRIATLLSEIRDPERERYRQQMLHNPEWLDLIREKAAKAGVPVEEAMEKDIDWLIQNGQ